MSEVDSRESRKGNKQVQISLSFFSFSFFSKYLLKDVAVKGKGNEEELKEPVR